MIGFFDAFTLGNWMYFVATICYGIAAICFFLILYEIYRILKISHLSNKDHTNVTNIHLGDIKEQLAQLHSTVAASKVEYHIQMPKEKKKQKKAVKSKAKK